MQKSGFSEMHHYAGFSQIGSHIAVHCILVGFGRLDLNGKQ